MGDAQASSGGPSKATDQLSYHEVVAKKAAKAAAAAAVAAPSSGGAASEGGAGLRRTVNFRDLHSVSSAIQPGRVFRSSQVVSASDLEGLGVSAVLDLRQPPVACKTDQRNLRQALRDGVWSCLGWMTGLVGGQRSARSARGAAGGGGASVNGTLAQAPPPPPCYRCTQETCEYYGIRARVYHVDLLPTSVSLRILWELPRGLQARVLWAAARREHPEPIVAGAVADPQVMGYLKLYKLLLERAKPRLAAAVRLAADAENLPLLVHCIHGKDRTGLVAMLLLLLCSVDREEVVRDYALSESLLQESRENQQLLGLAEHLTTDQVIASAAQVMHATIDHVESRYGSAHNYLKALGLSDEELQAIVRNLTHPLLALPAPTSAACGSIAEGAGGEAGEPAGRVAAEPAPAAG